MRFLKLPYKCTTLYRYCSFVIFRSGRCVQIELKFSLNFTYSIYFRILAKILEDSKKDLYLKPCDALEISIFEIFILSEDISKNQVPVDDSCHRHSNELYRSSIASSPGGICFIFHLLVSNIHNMSPATPSSCRLYSLCNDTKQITPTSSFVRRGQFCVEILLRLAETLLS